MGKVQWTDRSVKDLHSIFDFINQDSPFYAERFVKSLIQSTIKLESMPNIGRDVPELPNLKLREIIYKNFRIVYRIEKNQDIIIIAVIHSARDFISTMYE